MKYSESLGWLRIIETAAAQSATIFATDQSMGEG